MFVQALTKAWAETDRVRAALQKKTSEVDQLQAAAAGEAKRVADLMKKMQAEHVPLCNICFNQGVDHVSSCGHPICGVCAASLPRPLSSSSSLPHCPFCHVPYARPPMRVYFNLGV